MTTRATTMPAIVEPSIANVRRAAAMLHAGDVVAFPTETVYGLGAATGSTAALRRVYELKGRPADNPLIAHVADAARARAITSGWDDRCSALADAFWPGPLTIVLRRRSDVPPIAAGGRDTIAVRCPDNDIARSLLQTFGGAVSAPSANRSGHISPTTAQHVADDFAGVPDLLVLDGGRSPLGIESTVLDLTGEPRILRRGGVEAAALSALLGPVEVVEATEQTASPGTSAVHYAPRTPATLVDGATLTGMLAAATDRCCVLCFDTSVVPNPHEVIAMPSDAGAYAHELYEALRCADTMGCDRILVERPPGTGELWDAINDRLRRACAEP